MPPQIVYDQIERLVTRFKQLSARERNAYNEADTRKDFILPLFRALEWNIDDAREVAAEEKISRGYVDFSFRLNGVRRFVLETKRIGEDLNKPEWAQQAIDYAYHKGVTWAVLSDFEGLKIFNAEAREQNPFQAQFKAFSVDEYLTRLDELWWLSRSAVQAGVLDREAEKVFKKIPRTPIAQALFDNLLEWRKDLYKNLREYNRTKLWTPKQIDDAVQRILDRLIFTRTAEDRLMEDEKLIALVRENSLPQLIPALKRRFAELDAVYNSQLFRPDFVDTLELGEPSTLAKIIEGLDRSPKELVRYNFALIDADVLGRVYEQYLGTVISERDQLEAKRAKRKAQGIYYTPTFVVKYIVQQTLGRYLAEHDYHPAHPIRVLDPACGSGSFLIEAFEVLDQHIARQRGQDRGTYDIQDHARQREILEQCIYGVDKDEQAVEVARLNLLLKALHLREKLPTLTNIRCGDSLISGDAAELEKYFGAKWKERNPFDWHAEFDKVMAEGGFDVIVGNPPYGATLTKEEVEYLLTKFKLQTYQLDTYMLFLEKSLRLLKPNGFLGMIVPNTWLVNLQSNKFREFVFRYTTIENIVHYRRTVFEEATVDTEVLILRNQAPDTSHQIRITVVEREGGTSEHFIAQKRWIDGNGSPVNIYERTELEGLREKLRSHPLLDAICQITQGTKPFQVGKGKPPQSRKIVEEKPFVSDKKKNKTFRPLLRGSLIQKYVILWNNDYWISFGDWLAEPRYSANYDAKEKIVVRQTGDSLVATLDRKQFIVRDNLYTIVPRKSYPNLCYVLGILNSRLMNWFYQTILNPERGEALAQVKRGHLARLPIRRINFADPAEKKQHDEIVALVEEMLELQKEYAAAAREKFADKMDALKRRIDAVDAAIDAIVYQLYGLSEEEIRIVEERTR